MLVIVVVVVVVVVDMAMAMYCTVGTVPVCSLQYAAEWVWMSANVALGRPRHRVPQCGRPQSMAGRLPSNRRQVKRYRKPTRPSFHLRNTVSVSHGMV